MTVNHEGLDSKEARTSILYEIVGWYGTLAIVGAYALVSFRIIGASSVIYQLLNLTGAVGIIIISFKKGVTQSVVLNTFWAAIAFIALGSIFLH